jgi:exoribonuclease-2
MTIKPGSLGLYKGHPALIQRVDKKVELQLEDGQLLSVRPKDFTILHPGPLQSLHDLRRDGANGDPTTAWELLAGTITSLPELAELIYDHFSPATAWATWQLVSDGLLFSGQPGAITVHTAEQVEIIRHARQTRAAEGEAWQAFMARMESGRFAPEDDRYLSEVAAVALGKQTQSRVLRALGRAEDPETAHALLLTAGYWDATVNPYPSRLNVTTIPPDPSLLPFIPHPLTLILPEEARRDLTHLTALAIDDEGNRDPDDALSLDGDILWVHVADVAALVPSDSPADLEARGRGVSLYLPEGTVPMLSTTAAEALGLGLQPVSPALSFGLRLNPAGEVIDLEIVPSQVRVTRMSYQEAEARLEEAHLAELHRVALINRARRINNSAIEISLPEVKVRAKDGQVEIRPILPLRSREVVREAMLMTGEAVARYALAYHIPMPFTIQEAPEIQPDSLPPADDLAAMFALRRTMQRSQQQLADGASPGGHAGLGLPMYVQCTSPLRRYLDLVAHQQLRAHLRSESPLDRQELILRLGAADASGRNVRTAERFSIDHWKHVYLLQNPGWVGEGVVVEKQASRVLVVIPELDLEAFLYQRGGGKLNLNGRVRLELRDVDLPRRDAAFRLAR